MTYDPNKWCLKCGQRGHSSQACVRVKVLPKPHKQRGYIGQELSVGFLAALLCGTLLMGYLSVELSVYVISKGVSEGLEKSQAKPVVDGVAHLGEWKGKPIYAKLDAEGGVSITYSSKPMPCPNDPHPNCTYTPAYIDLNAVPK